MKQTNKKWLLLAAGDGETRWLRDHSRHRRDAQLKGDRCHVDGTLNLTDNISTDFDTNGYLLLPSHLLDSLRSYTVLFSATPDELDRLQRFYDFGSGSANSLFLRAGTFAAGCKVGGRTTTLFRADELQVGTEQLIAVSFDARTQITTIYVDGCQVAQSHDIKYEPYQLLANGADTRNYIGRSQWWDTSSRNDNGDYVGTLDNFRLYGLCLTANEIDDVLKKVNTGIDFVQREEQQKVNGSWSNGICYDLSGRHVRRSTISLSGLQGGMYVIGGKKVVK